MNLKQQLLALIKNSATFQSLPEAERNSRIKMMFSANDETIKKIITILENEAKEINTIDKDFAAQVDEINNLVAEANQLGKEANRLFVQEEETAARSTEEEEAEKLLKQLED